MRVKILNRVTSILIFAFLFVSCSSDLDFDQANNLKLKPVFVANLAYFNLPATQFVNDGSEQVAFDVKEFDAFRKEFFTDNLVKTELDFEVENTVTRAFTVEVLLLNDSDQVLETIRFQIPAYAGNQNIIKFPTEIFENQRLELLKQTTRVGFIVQMAAGPPIDENSSGKLKLRSSATVYMEIE